MSMSSSQRLKLMKESNESRFRRRKSVSSSKVDRRRRRQRHGVEERGRKLLKKKEEEEEEEEMKQMKDQNNNTQSTSIALDIVRSIRAALPPNEDILELARQREQNRPKTPPNEWKKTNNLFNDPVEVELGDFYVTKRDFWNARHFYERAKDLLKDVFREDEKQARVLPNVLEKLGQVQLRLGQVKDAVSNLDRALWCRKVDQTSKAYCKTINSMCDALLRRRDYAGARQLLSEHSHTLRFAHMKAVRDSDTSLALSCLEEMEKMEVRISNTSRDQDRDEMYHHDERADVEERWRMHDHDLRMTPEQQQIMVALKVMRISDGFELLRAFAEHSEAHFRLDFWNELQDFKTTKSGTQDFATSVRHIYDKFIVPRAVLPVLPNEMRGDIHDALDIDSGVKVTRHVFDDAESLILASIVRYLLFCVCVRERERESNVLASISLHASFSTANHIKPKHTHIHTHRHLILYLTLRCQRKAEIFSQSIV